MMTAFILPQPFKKILVVGPINDKLSKIKSMTPLYDWIILNGGLFFQINNLNNNIEQMNELMKSGKIIYNIGKQDLLLLSNLEFNDPVSQWIRACPNIVFADYISRSVIIVDGGIPNTIKTRNDLLNNLEISFVSQINKNPWHKSYGGGLGYIISNNPLTSKSPQFYNYSMQLGTESDVYAQEVNDMGLKQTILL